MGDGTGSVPQRSSLLSALRARGSGVLAALVTSGPTPGSLIAQAESSLPIDLQTQVPLVEALAEPLEPMKVELPRYLESTLPTLLDPRLPAKKMPRFTEFCSGEPGPQQLEPLLLSQHLPAAPSERRFPEAR